MPSLFNMPTPEEVRREARMNARQEALLFAQGQGKGPVMAASQAGALFGEGIARAAGGKLPEEVRAEKYQALQQAVTAEFDADGDGRPDQPANEDDYMKLLDITAKHASQFGLMDVAEQAMSQKMQLRMAMGKSGQKDVKYISGETGVGVFDPSQPSDQQFKVSPYPEGFKPLGSGKSAEQIKQEELLKQDRIRIQEEERRKTNALKVEKDIEASKEKVLDKTNVKALDISIDEGLKAADSIAPLIKAQELLKIVRTSGADAGILRAKQLVGIDAANQGQLYNLLGKNIVAQLRPTLGAQFTAAEGNWLKAMEADFGKSVETNEPLVDLGHQLVRVLASRGYDPAIVFKQES